MKRLLAAILYGARAVNDKSPDLKTVQTHFDRWSGRAYWATVLLSLFVGCTVFGICMLFAALPYITGGYAALAGIACGTVAAFVVFFYTSRLRNALDTANTGLTVARTGWSLLSLWRNRNRKS